VKGLRRKKIDTETTARTGSPTAGWRDGRSLERLEIRRMLSREKTFTLISPRAKKIYV